MSEGREDALDTQINNRSLVTMGMAPGFPSARFFPRHANFSDLINFQCEEHAIKIT